MTHKRITDNKNEKHDHDFVQTGNQRHMQNRIELTECSDPRKRKDTCISFITRRKKRKEKRGQDQTRDPKESKVPTLDPTK